MLIAESFDLASDIGRDVLVDTSTFAARELLSSYGMNDSTEVNIDSRLSSAVQPGPDFNFPNLCF